MRLIKFIKCMSLLTVLTLVYIHMQMQIFDLAYRGKQKEMVINDLSEQNGTIAYDILKMKSAHHLGTNLLAEGSGLRFRDDESVIKLAVTPEPPQGEVVLRTAGLSARQNIMKFLSAHFTREAQAQEKQVASRPWQGKSLWPW